tara:strand:- start:329 stop:484 length:156 start_codon:yes stop_codon:yes gene_type:complete
VAFLVALLYFWCTYRHIREPDGGRCDDASIEEARRLSIEIARENRLNNESV